MMCCSSSLHLSTPLVINSVSVEVLHETRCVHGTISHKQCQSNITTLQVINVALHNNLQHNTRCNTPGRSMTGSHAHQAGFPAWSLALVLQASEGRHLFLRLLSKDCPSFDGFFLKLGLDGLRIIGLSTPIRGKGPWLSPPRCHKTWHLVSRDASPSQAGPASIPSGGGQAVHG